MTRDHLASIVRTAAGRCRRTGATALVALTATVAVVVAVPDAAGGRPRTESEAVAAEAGRALDALERWEDDQNPADYVRFVQSRELAATLTAAEIDVDSEALRAAWAEAPIEKQHAVLAAMSQLGVRYVYLAADPDVGFDCSGLTLWAYEQAGIEIPRSSKYQIRASVRVDAGEAEAGDLVFYPGHISMYLGAGAVVHSPQTGKRVEALQVTTKRKLTYGDAVAGAPEPGSGDAAGWLLVDGAAAVAK